MNFTIVSLPHNVVEPILAIIHDILINQIQEPEDVAPDVFGESIISHFNYWITNVTCLHLGLTDATVTYPALSIDDVDDISETLYTKVVEVLPYILTTVRGDYPYVSITIRQHGGISVYVGHSSLLGSIPREHVTYVNRSVNRMVETTLMEGTY